MTTVAIAADDAGDLPAWLADLNRQLEEQGWDEDRPRHRWLVGLLQATERLAAPTPQADDMADLATAIAFRHDGRHLLLVFRGRESIEFDQRVRRGDALRLLARGTIYDDHVSFLRGLLDWLGGPEPKEA